MTRTRLAVALPPSVALSVPALVQADGAPDAVRNAEEAVDLFKTSDPTPGRFVESSMVWCVFPPVAKGALIVAAASGAAATARYQQGMAVSTVASGGLMYEASVGGRKLGFTPFEEGRE